MEIATQLSASTKPARGSWRLAAWWMAVYCRAHLLALSGILKGAGGQEPVMGDSQESCLPQHSAALSCPQRSSRSPQPLELPHFRGLHSKRHPAFFIFPITLPYRANSLKSQLASLLLLVVLGISLWMCVSCFILSVFRLSSTISLFFLSFFFI